MSEDNCSRFMHYLLSQSEKREAYEKYNYASTLLELRKVKERAAEVASQHEPLASRFSSEQRELVLDIIRYVVDGRKLREVQDE